MIDAYFAVRGISLELAAMVCLNRAQSWCDKQVTAANNGEPDSAVIYKARRDEADECRLAIRRTAQTVTVDEANSVMAMSSIVSQLATTFGGEEYNLIMNLLRKKHIDLTGKPFPFPVQPSTPPFDNQDQPQKSAA